MGESRHFPGAQIVREDGQARLSRLLNKPVEFGGSGLDYSYAMAFAEELGQINCGGVPMAIGVQTDMATPALARFGNDEVRANSWRHRSPAICRLPRRVGSGRGLGRRVGENDGEEGRRRLRHQRRQDVDDQRHAGRLDLPARQHFGRSGPSQQVADLRSDEDQRASKSPAKLDKMGMHSSDTAQIYFDNVRVPQRYLVGEEGKGFTYQMVQFQEERLWAPSRA